MQTTRQRVNLIIDRITDGTGVSRKVLFGRCRFAYVVEIRHRCFRAIRRETHLNLPQIGALFNRDHTTILHGIRKQDVPVNTLLGELHHFPFIRPTPAAILRLSEPGPAEYAPLDEAPPPPEPVYEPAPIAKVKAFLEAKAPVEKTPEEIERAAMISKRNELISITTNLIYELTGQRGYASVRPGRDM
jgi:hypothetical protein